MKNDEKFLTPPFPYTLYKKQTISVARSYFWIFFQKSSFCFAFATFEEKNL